MRWQTTKTRMSQLPHEYEKPDKQYNPGRESRNGDSGIEQSTGPREDGGAERPIPYCRHSIYGLKYILL